MSASFAGLVFLGKGRFSGLNRSFFDVPWVVGSSSNLGLVMSSGTTESFACRLDQKAPSCPPPPPALEEGCDVFLVCSPDEGGGGGLLRGTGCALYAGFGIPVTSASLQLKANLKYL